MVATALWSAHLTNQVHLQLRTLSRSLFPLAMTMSDLHAVAQADKTLTNLNGVLNDARPGVQAFSKTTVPEVGQTVVLTRIAHRASAMPPGCRAGQHLRVLRRVARRPHGIIQPSRHRLPALIYDQ